MEKSRDQAKTYRRNKFLKKAKVVKDFRALAMKPSWRSNEKNDWCHWDKLLEEMKWMANDFREERKWKMTKAKVFSKRCARVVLEDRPREKRDAQERERRRECSKVAKEVQRFWTKAEKIVQLRWQQEVDAEKKVILDKHLKCLVSQTEQYSAILAENLTTEGPSSDKPKSSVRDAEMYSDDLEDEEVFDQEAELDRDGELVELEALNAEAELSLEELMQRYQQGMDVPSAEPSEAKSRETSGVARATGRCKIPFLLKHELRDYQHTGLDWLVTLHEKRINGILADEMGLGKTIQTIALLAWLAVERGSWGPHLIVVPTSVMLNWEMEFKKWCPAFKLLTYYGTARERKQKRHGWSKLNSFHVCITSYALILQDCVMFRRKKWDYLILDEAHMIKNWKSQRWQTLLRFNSRRRLLLTGTPLQNDLMELWSLMHFLMPHVFSSHAHFKNWFCNPLNEMAADRSSTAHHEVVPRLHGVLRPFILRRLKSEVEQQLPQKHEHVVYCTMSKRQKKLYEEYMASTETKSTLASKNFMGIINVLMQLRKVCNHPDLFEGRPIVSPFDVDPIELQWPSVLSPLENWTPQLSFGFDSAFIAGKLKWMQEEALRLAESWNTISSVGLESLAELFEEEKDEFASRFGQSRDDAMDAVMESISAQFKRKLEVRQDQLRFMHKLSSMRHEDDSFPQFPDFLCSMVPIWYAGLSGAWVRSYGQRAALCTKLIKCFMCVIPKARSKPPSRWYSHPDFAQINRAKRLAQIQTAEYNSRNQIFWPAIARSRLYFPDRRLIQFDCGKLQTLAVLLRQLYSQNHRVLVFTQMSRVLDVLEEFLNIHGYRYLRLDGSTKPEVRQAQVQRFNHDYRIFAFILSTRSGGVGVNLTGADTVIFYDSDWNPAMDKQAQDRCHRIGQTREVHIYRLVTKFTVEENILKKSEEKKQLDYLAIQSGEFNLQFLDRLNPGDLMEEALDIGVSVEEVRNAMRNAEDETDAEAAKVVEAETAEELAEFNPDTSGDMPDRSTDRESRLDSMLQLCSPIERFAVKKLEQEGERMVDVEVAARQQLDGLDEDELQLPRLEDLSEDDKAFEVVDWDPVRAESVYREETRALQELLEQQRQELLEAERRKQEEYLRRLTEQQRTYSAMPRKKRKDKAMDIWRRLWHEEGQQIHWTAREDCMLCLLAESVLQVMTPSGTVRGRLTWPNGIGSATELVLNNSRLAESDIYVRNAQSCKLRLRRLLAAREAPQAEMPALCRQITEACAKFHQQGVYNRKEADVGPVSAKLSLMTELTDSVIQRSKEELSEIVTDLSEAVNRVAPRAIGEVHFILTMASRGIQTVYNRLSVEAKPLVTPPLPEAPRHQWSSPPSASAQLQPTLRQSTSLFPGIVAQSPSVKIHPTSLQAFLTDSASEAGIPAGVTFTVPYTWAMNMSDPAARRERRIALAIVNDQGKEVKKPL